MNASASALARIAGIALVLILAAILGLVAGNALNARSAGAGVGAGGVALPHMGGFDGARYSAVQADGAGNPAYADRPDAVFPNVWGNVADDGSDAAGPANAAVFPNVWGNIESGNEAAAGSATAPTPR